MNAKMCENEKAVCGNEKAIIEKHNRILSTISHDLKSPMVALLGFSRILLKEIEDARVNQRWPGMLRTIIDSGEDMFGLIEDILAMALVYIMPIYLLRSMEGGSVWTDQYVKERRS